MQNVIRSYTKMMATLEQGVGDLEKFQSGNNSAGTRIRKAMQEVKSLAQDVRVGVQEVKNTVSV